MSDTNPIQVCEIVVERRDDGRWSVWVRGQRVPSAADIDLQVALGRVAKALTEYNNFEIKTAAFLADAVLGLKALAAEQAAKPRTPIAPQMYFTGSDARVRQQELTECRLYEAENAGPHELLDGMIASGSLEQALADEVQGYGTLGPDERAWRDVNALTLKELRST